MMVVTGLSVTFLIFSRMEGPYPDSFVSTTMTPVSVTSTPVLPPVNSLPGGGCDHVQVVFDFLQIRKGRPCRLRLGEHRRRQRPDRHERTQYGHPVHGESPLRGRLYACNLVTRLFPSETRECADAGKFGRKRPGTGLARRRPDDQLLPGRIRPGPVGDRHARLERAVQAVRS